MSSLQNFIHLLFSFHYRHRAQAAITWAVLLVLSSPVFLISIGLGTWIAYYIATMILLAVAGFVFYEVVLYEQGLIARRHYEGEMRMCEVKVNEVVIAEIDDADYAAVQLKAFADYRVWLAQVGYYAGVGVQLISRMVRLIPMIAFWCVVAAYVFQHDLLLELVQTATAEEVVASIPNVMTSLIILACLVMCVQYMFTQSKRYALDTVYQRAYLTGVRKAIGCPADGDITVTATFAVSVPMQIALSSD